VRQINFGFDLVAIRAAGASRLAGGLSVAPTEMSPHLVGLVVFKGAGMGLLFRDPDFCQYVENGFALNFQLSGQIVDSNLAHPPSGPPKISR